MRVRQSLETLKRHSGLGQALKVIETLHTHGFAAVFAGGCVRDGLLGVTPKDLDIATSAQPSDVEALFERTIPVGKEFGTILVVGEGHDFEVTTFRKEGPYHDGRRPSEVHFTDIEQDAHRRDFTVNALYYDPVKGEVLDFVGGLKDLSSRHLRTVGVAEERFLEDRLRMLRAARFVSQLGFDLDAEATQAIHRLHSKLKSVSAERILAETKRLLQGSHLIEGLRTLQQTALAEDFWSEILELDLKKLNFFPSFQNWENAYVACMWMSEAQEPALLQRLRLWKASRDSLRRAQSQFLAARELLDPNTKRADRVRALGSETYAEVITLLAGILAPQDRLQDLESWIQEYLSVANSEGGLPKPWVSGQDLIAQGVAQGAGMGEILKRLYDEQLEGRLRSKAEALERIKTL